MLSLTSATLAVRGHVVLPEAPKGAIAVTHPYRPGSEDWMLFNVINQLRAAGHRPILVQEKARENEGGYVGISVWRPGVTRIDPQTQIHHVDTAAGVRRRK